MVNCLINIYIYRINIFILFYFILITIYINLIFIFFNGYIYKYNKNICIQNLFFFFSLCVGEHKIPVFIYVCIYFIYCIDMFLLLLYK